MKCLLALSLAILAVGCASFSNNVFRTEQTAVDTAFAAYVGWTNYYATATNSATITPDRLAKLNVAVADIRTARIHFSATVSTLEGFRAAYETNSAVQPTIQAAVDSALSQSSNIVWLINYWRQQ